MEAPTSSPLAAHLRDCLQRAADAQAADSRPEETSAGCGEALLQLVTASREGGDDFRAALSTEDKEGDVDSGRPLLDTLLLVANTGMDETQVDAILETAVRALVVVPTLGLPPREHDRLLQLALEVAAAVLQAASSTSLSAKILAIATKNVCGLLRRPEEDTGVLLTGIKVLAMLLRNRADGDVELGMDSVSALMRVLTRTVRELCNAVDVWVRSD
jgi:hypothetical protein